MVSEVGWLYVLVLGEDVEDIFYVEFWMGIYRFGFLWVVVEDKLEVFFKDWFDIYFEVLG